VLAQGREAGLPAERPSGAAGWASAAKLKLWIDDTIVFQFFIPSPDNGLSAGVDFKNVPTGTKVFV